MNVFKNAVLEGDLEKVKKEIEENGVDVNMDNDYGLRWSARNGHMEMVKYFLRKGGGLKNTKNISVRNAIEGNHLEIVKLLIKHGANINMSVEGEEDSFVIAGRNGYYEMIKYLIESGLNLGEEKMKDGLCKILELTTNSFLNMMRREMNREDESTRTNRMKIAKLFIEKGFYDETVFTTALKEGFDEIMDMLIDRNAFDEYGFELCVRSNKVEALRKMIKKRRGKLGDILKNCFIRACMDNKEEIVELLWNIGVRDDENDTCLMITVSHIMDTNKNRIEIFKKIFRSKERTEICKNKLLIYAASMGDYSVVEYLVKECNAHVGFDNNRALVAGNKRYNELKKFEEFGIFANKIEKMKEMIEFMIEHGADSTVI